MMCFKLTIDSSEMKIHYKIDIRELRVKDSNLNRGIRECHSPSIHCSSDRDTPNIVLFSFYDRTRSLNPHTQFFPLSLLRLHQEPKSNQKIGNTKTRFAYTQIYIERCYLKEREREREIAR